MHRLSRIPATTLLVSAISLIGLGGCQKKSAVTLPPQQVGVFTLEQQSVHVVTQLPGRLEAYEIAMVRPQVNGVIQQRLFVQGAEVKAGEQLYQIDPGIYKAALDSANGRLAKAKAAAITAEAKLKRYTSLVHDKAVSKQDYDDALATARSAQADVQVAEGDVETATVNFGYTKVFSPITGRIGRSLLTVGALVTSGQTSNLAVVTRLDPIYVDVNLPASTLLRLRRELASGRLQRAGDNATKAVLQLDDGSTYELPGRLDFSEVNVSETTSTVVVRATFPNPQNLLLPGMYVHTQLDEGTDPDALLVPQQAVSRDGQGNAHVMTIGQGNKVEVHNIVAEVAQGSNWIVTGDVKAGDKVIVTGLQKIHPGNVVTPVPWSAPSDNTSAPSDGK